MVDDLDLRLYAILDPEQTGGRALPDLARMVVAGGATLVQLRDKTSSLRDLIALARALKGVMPADVPLIVNDRVDVVIEAGADGVHLGQDDGSAIEARERLGPVPFIGLTVQTAEQARAAPLACIDYAGIGGVFATPSKIGSRAPIGISGLREIVGVFRYRIGNFPMCAIAGITRDNVADVIAAGVDGVAVISAVSRSADPRQAARELRAAVDAALLRRAPVVPDTRERHHERADS